PRVGQHLAVGAGLRDQRNLQLEQHGRRPGQGVLRGLGRRRPKSKNRRRVRRPPDNRDLTQRRPIHREEKLMLLPINGRWLLPIHGEVARSAGGAAPEGQRRRGWGTAENRLLSSVPLVTSP